MRQTAVMIWAGRTSGWAGPEPPPLVLRPSRQRPADSEGAGAGGGAHPFCPSPPGSRLGGPPLGGPPPSRAARRRAGQDRTGPDRGCIPLPAAFCAAGGATSVVSFAAVPVACWLSQ
jgi:hypothetical protein